MPVQLRQARFRIIRGIGHHRDVRRSVLGYGIPHSIEPAAIPPADELNRRPVLPRRAGRAGRSRGSCRAGWTGRANGTDARDAGHSGRAGRAGRTGGSGHSRRARRPWRSGRSGNSAAAGWAGATGCSSRTWVARSAGRACVAGRALGCLILRGVAGRRLGGAGNRKRQRGEERGERPSAFRIPPDSPRKAHGRGISPERQESRRAGGGSGASPPGGNSA